MSTTTTSHIVLFLLILLPFSDSQLRTLYIGPLSTDNPAEVRQVIVYFEEYKRPSEHLETLVRGMPDYMPEVVSIQLARQSLHTDTNDFILVDVGLSAKEAWKEVLAILKQVKGVKNAAINRKIESKLYSAEGVMQRRELKAAGVKLSEVFDLDKYHKQGITGKGVKIAIFDSGLADVYMDPSALLRVKQIINFTHDRTARDTLGHGTFISGVVGSQNPSCPGIAPDAEIYVLKLFTAERVSYTSWFLDAFNFVLQNGIDIVNLSNGSSDFLDIPFIEKINELTANGVVIVSAIGNEGPFQGTLNNPGDLINVIGIGSLDYAQTNVAQFSSRGMTTWSLLDGIGTLKPDLITAGSMILGLGTQGECTTNSGTSVSASIITASIALTLSAIPEVERRHRQNTAWIKLSMLRTARKLKNLSVTEQGAGVFDLDGFFTLIVSTGELGRVMVHP